MARIIPIHSDEQASRAIAEPGYTAILFYKDGDCPSQSMIGQCCAYSRSYPFIGFWSINIDTYSGSLSRFSLSFVPTVIFYRNGKHVRAVIGTDYVDIERRMKSMEHDGPALNPQRTIAAHHGRHRGNH